MNAKPLIVTCMVGNEEKQILLNPEYPSSHTYQIFIDKENQSMVQKAIREWIVGFNENNSLNDQHSDAIIRAASSAEYHIK